MFGYNGREETSEKSKGSEINYLRRREYVTTDDKIGFDTKGAYPWTGGSTLGSYFVSVTSSHYDWAMKKLKAHAKKIKNAGK